MRVWQSVAWGLAMLLSAMNLQAQPERAAPLPFVLDMVHHNPGEPLFVTKFNQPAHLKSWGYTGQNPKFFVQTAVHYDALDAALVPKGSPERLWSDKTAAFIDERIQEAAASQMPLYPFTDVLVVPKALLAKYGDQMKVDGRISILRPMTQTVLRTQLAAIFDRFPGLAGITMRFGETFLQDTPHHAGESPAHSIAEHQTLIALLRDEACVKRNKQLFYRTWSWDGINLHTNPQSYAQVTDAIEPHPKLIFSIKHASGDFVRGVPFNRTIGLGKHRQIVEVSVNQAGLYGKNAHPYYIGQGVIEGWEEMGERKKGLRDLVGSQQLAGVWTWTAGDGWEGPYITNEFWVDLNAWVISRWAQQPWRSEPELFAQYARDVLKLQPAQARVLRELSLLATSATYRGQQSALFYVWPFLLRDDYLAALNLDDVVAKHIQVEVLEEKNNAVTDWRRVEALAREVQLPNRADQEFLEVSATYGRIKMALVEEIWTMQILAAERKRDRQWDVARLRRALDEYDTLWQEWRQLKRDHPSCPTLYKERKSRSWGSPPGMDEAVREYRRVVGP
jgi:hypothetical protein